MTAIERDGGVFVIAEAGVNHNGSLERALAMIDVAADAGADAIKFQTFVTGEVISRSAPKAAYQTVTTGAEESQYEMVRKLELGADEHLLLVERCRRRGIAFLSTPFDLPSLRLLTGTLEVPLVKISSGEITNPLLLLNTARSGKPVILSTGMCSLGDVERALGVLAFGYTASEAAPSLEGFRQAYRSDEGQGALREMVTLLHCTTEYPAPLAEVNLRAMDTLRGSFGLPVGYSDHTKGITVPIAAAARGAAVVEKHFTLDSSLPGPDHSASLEPQELKAMVTAIREVEAALGSPLKAPAPSELKNAPIARKSLVARCGIRKGEAFSEENLALKRPGTGISPFQYWDLIGRAADRDYREDEVISQHAR